MTLIRFYIRLTVVLLFVTILPNYSFAWHDETHLAIAKAAKYYKWYNAAGADMIKIKAGFIERYNHYSNNPPGTVITPEMVLKQADLYNKTDDRGHLYGAIIASLRDYKKDRQREKYGEYHLAFCAHYVGDLSQPLHNTFYNEYNRTYHKRTDSIVNDRVLESLEKIKIYSITINSEKDLADEIARIANFSIQLGNKVENEARLITEEEAYIQIGHSASLFKAIMQYVDAISLP
ncbi:MAG: hypothetical protein K9L30_13245 [Desulfobacterales bacterium]|nr:hypothetical protein [Desulfobacterales bacterium]